MFHAKLPWLILCCFGIFLVFGSSEADARRGCSKKRRRCLWRCAKKARKQKKRCKKKSGRQRARCIKTAYRSGRKCVKKQSCPLAEECYKRCNQTANPIACFAKQKCPAKRTACYSTCQSPIGQVLKQCLDSTGEQLKSCSKNSGDWQQSCQSSCPSCP